MSNVTVTTTIPLETSLKNKVEKFILKKTGSAADIEYIIETEILGGIIIKIGDVVYDGSIKRQLDKLKQNF